MGGLSQSGLVGALVGLVVGAVDYVLIVAVMARVMRRRLAGDGRSVSPDALTARLRPIKLALFASSFVAFPLVGYVAGSLLTSGGDAR